MYESRRFAHRKRFHVFVDPVILAMLAGAVLLICGILIGHAATSAINESAAQIANAIVR